MDRARMSGAFAAAIAGWLTTAGVAGAGTDVFDVQFDVPTLDRWNYPFNATPGVRPVASIFGVIDDPEFDDRDAQFLLGFDTIGVVPTGEGPSSYVITDATLTVTTITGGVFVYDPTSDPHQSYLDESDPDFIPDEDDGRPIELFGVGFRNGFTAETFLETSPFQQAPFGNWQGTRNAYATDFLGGEPRDVSRNVEMEFDPFPFAVGAIEALTPGQVVPSNTEITFELDLSNPDVVAYLREGLDDGRLRFMVTSIHEAAVMGEGEQTWPDFYTKENKFAIPFGFAATLSMKVEVGGGNPADLNGDGAVDGADLAILLAQWGTDGSADLNDDGVVDGADLAILLANWTG